MKMTRIAALAGLVMISAGSAFAADIQIDITGKVQDTTCVVQSTAGKHTRAVKLETVTTTALSSAGETAGLKSEQFDISGCNTEFTKVTLAFENPANYSKDGRLINTFAGDTAAKNVEIQVLNGTSPVNLLTERPVFNIQGRSATLPMAFQYYATGAATQGDVASQLIISLIYN